MKEKQIGNFIEELLEEKGLTEESLAQELEVSEQTIKNWENATKRISNQNLIKISNALDVSLLELVSGKKMKKSELEKDANKTVESLLKSFKKDRIKTILASVLATILTLFIALFLYKAFLVHKYTLERPENVEKIVEGLKNKKEIKIEKQEGEIDYLTVGHIKIRNDFYDLTKEEKDDNITYQKEEEGKITMISFPKEEASPQLVDNYITSLSLKNTTEADRKYFLLKNNIQNDIDLYKYIAKNYYKRNTILMDERTLMDNFTFNTFVSIVIPEVESITYLKGDIEGMIFTYATKNEVTPYYIEIIHNNKIYSFLTNDERFADEEYLKDILGTIEID